MALIIAFRCLLSTLNCELTYNLPPMRLTSRQSRVLAAICDTFAPARDALPSASDLGVPDAVLRAIAALPRESDRRQFAQLLSVWDSRLHGLLAAAGFRRFSELPLAERERILLSWCDSRIPMRRAAFQALRKAALLMYYTLPATGGRNPSWDRIGYPGPPGPPANPPSKQIRPLAVERDTQLDCDVCVVGSGAGGGTAAGVLAAAGLAVVVLEAGDYFDDADFDGAELAGLQRLYMQAGGAATSDQGFMLLAGECLGGGTVVNYTTSFRTPENVRDEWAAHGVPEFAGAQFTRSLDAVVARLGVNTDHNRPSSRDAVLQRGLTALGWHVDAMPRNVIGCDQGHRCGYCGFGCALGAKQSTVKTWLLDASHRGARILVSTRAHRVLVERGVASGVEATNVCNGCRVTVRARAVVVACGSIQTPALLRRSGLTNRNIGRHLHLHPVTAVWGEFSEEVRPWEGTIQALYSDQFRDLHGGYGLKFETTAEHPALAAAFLPWRSARQSSSLLARLKNMAGIGVLLRDRDTGIVRVARDGHPVAHYALSDFDLAHMRVGVRAAAQLLEAAGARRILSSHARDVSYELGKRGSLDSFCRDADLCGWAAGRCAYASFHIMGTARMGGSPSTSVCNPQGETWEARNLWVCDASTFPTSSGVNPMVTIEAIAHLNARALAARLA